MYGSGRSSTIGGNNSANPTAVPNLNSLFTPTTNAGERYMASMFANAVAATFTLAILIGLLSKTAPTLIMSDRTCNGHISSTTFFSSATFLLANRIGTGNSCGVPETSVVKMNPEEETSRRSIGLPPLQQDAGQVILASLLAGKVQP